ncbi:DUF4097 domain-containing protein [Pontibacillus sp. HMF3514]|uniref:DUF4097 family beta strand repeat-containing protein n=1 Tax=Pontibacillus sp. HMF3514 TaxID=2692425 RepID=UPI0013201FA5|nr:DUF4097 domain-containing protein [Pontibacillus sp. HMF3514]QHE53560.1 DUF4097 family beta strand repeat protein [Pontibacillus sp. HMF3514]
MSEERKRILKMIEDQVITAEEAEELLESLKHAENVEKEETQQQQDLTTKVDWNAKQDQHHYESESTKKRFMNFVEDAVKKIKNVDLDFNFGHSYQVSHIFQYEGVSFSEMYLDISNGSTKVIPWEEEDVRIECEAKVYNAESRDAARKFFMDEKKFLVDDDSLRFAIASKKISANVKLYIPKKEYEKVSLRMFNGSINSEHLHAEELRAKTANGSIKLSHMRGDEWDIASSNGSITLKDIVCNELETESLNGSIKLDGEFGKVDSQVVNGSIHCDWHGDQGHTGFFKSLTGSIRINLSDDRRIDGELKTSVGSINCNLPEFKVIEEKKDVLKKELRFEAHSEKEKTLHLEAETKTGSVKVNSND